VSRTEQPVFSRRACGSAAEPATRARVSSTSQLATLATTVRNVVPHAANPRRRGEAVPQLPMLLHPLAPDVKCPACGAGLTFVRVRGYGDLYACASDCSCKCAVFHFQNKGTRACGYVVIYIYGPMGEWTACEAVKGE
jgi:hypothetical protein